jgi:hypothetical protein
VFEPKNVKILGLRACSAGHRRIAYALFAYTSLRIPYLRIPPCVYLLAYTLFAHTSLRIPYLRIRPCVYPICVYLLAYTLFAYTSLRMPYLHTPYLRIPYLRIPPSVSLYDVSEYAIVRVKLLCICVIVRIHIAFAHHHTANTLYAAYIILSK